MIGILCKENEKGFAREFFELFKTPWEFYVEGKMYNVVLSTENRIPQVNTNLTIIYSHAEIQNELSCGINRKVKYHGDIVFNNYFEIPIYGDLCTFEGEDQSLLKIKRNSESEGVRIHFSNSFLIRIGYNIFEEVAFLLKVGQPRENAHIPTLEIHISMLRNWILEAGIPIVEIPAIPVGYNFMICLTHDVDFIKITQHKFDHTLIGFLYRALFVSLNNFLIFSLSSG